MNFLMMPTLSARITYKEETYKEVDALKLLDLHLVRPVVKDALTVFPVWGGATVTRRGYDLSLTDLTVEARTGHAVVTELVVTNNGRRPARVLEGELLEAGPQVGVAARSMLLQPGETQVLEVRCVQQGRWAGSRANVRTGRRSFPRLRSQHPAQNGHYSGVVT